jgi:hypothetical protein
MEKTCKTCGSVYRITEFRTGMRDEDSIDCQVCGTELMSWNGGTMYEAELIRRNETWHKGDAQGNTRATK